MSDSVYLDSKSAGLGWLLDPASPRLGEVAREAEHRSPDAPCDAQLLLRDVEPLGELLPSLTGAATVAENDGHSFDRYAAR